jgi:hypothetical protein
MKVKLPIALFSIFFIVGCVPSLHQLWTEKTLVYDEAISGFYKEGKNVWEFIGDPSDKSYALIITDEDRKKSHLEAHLIKADGQLFLDLYPSDAAEVECGDWLKFHLITVHLFFKVELTDEMFALAAMNPDEVSKLLKEKPELVKHEIIKDRDRNILLTDAPENLQKFLLAAPKLNEKIFDNFEELVPIP